MKDKTRKKSVVDINRLNAVLVKVLDAMDDLSTLDKMAVIAQCSAFLQHRASRAYAEMVENYICPGCKTVH